MYIKKALKKTFFLLMITLLVLAVNYINCFADDGVIASGTCGDNLTWTLDNTGTLKLSGLGDMKSYSPSLWYQYKDSIKHVVVEEGITSIASFAFNDCSNLVSLDFPQGVTSIGTISGCSSLERITIPEGVTSVADIFGCDKLTSLDFPKGVISIGIIDQCNNITSINFSEGLERIQGVYSDRLTSITFPKGIQSIGWVGGNRLTSITFPEGLQNIGGVNCSRLTDLSFPDELQSIGYVSCPKVTSITIPPNVTSLGGFHGCTSLRSINIPEGVTEIGSETFYQCSSLESIIIPSKVKKIGDHAFYYCSNLTSVSIPDSVSEIEAYAFHSCSKIRNISIPNGTKSIGDLAFFGCNNLTSITIPPSVVSIGDGAFPKGSNIILKCEPFGSITACFIYAAFINYPCSSGWTDEERELWVTNAVWAPMHDVGEIVSETKPNCSIEGSRTYKCADCNQIVNETIPVDLYTHLWEEEYTVDVYPTCIEEGLESIHCSLCGLEKVGSKRTISATGHKWITAYKVDKKATCSEEGSESIHCSTCDEIKSGTSREINKVPHNYGEWVTTEAETCIENGSREKVCSECGNKVTEVIDATGHKWNTEYTVDKEATCYYEGYESIHCSVCDSIKPGSSKIIDMKPHSYGEWVISNEPSCTSSGDKERQCSECGTWDYDNIPAIGHKWNTEYTVDKEPSYTAEGSESIHCEVCATIKPESTRMIDKLNPSEKKGTDGTAVGPGASAEAAEAAIASMTSDSDLPGAVFNKLQLKSNKQTNTSISLSWKKVAGAKMYVIYGNKCGKANKMKRLVVSTSKSKKFTKVLGKKLKKGTYYKFIIVALDKDNKVVSSSKIIHVATKGGKVGNVGKVTTKAKKNKVSIKKGKTFKLAGKQVAATKALKVKKHRVLKYETSNKKIATVSSKGVIKGKKKGTCYVYAYAQNGVFAKIKVTIK